MRKSLTFDSIVVNRKNNTQENQSVSTMHLTEFSTQKSTWIFQSDYEKHTNYFIKMFA